MTTQGYFLLALGTKYVHECAMLVRMLRKQGDSRPVTLLIHPEDKVHAVSLGLFEDYVDFSPHDQEYWGLFRGVERWFIYPRLYLDVYISQHVPYDHTIVVDSDVLCQSGTHRVWEYMTHQPNDIVMLGFENDPHWHWGGVEAVSSAFGKHVPHTHGGFFYLRKSPFLHEFFSFCRDIFPRYGEYSCLSLYHGSFKTDEIIFAIGFANYGLRPLEFTEFPVMTFNYDATTRLPSKLQTVNGINKVMDDYIPFVHMFAKGLSDVFQTLYHRIMNMPSSEDAMNNPKRLRTSGRRRVITVHA